MLAAHAEVKACGWDAVYDALGMPDGKDKVEAMDKAIKGMGKLVDDPSIVPKPK